MLAPRARALKREEAVVDPEVLWLGLHQLDEINRAVKRHPAGHSRRSWWLAAHRPVFLSVRRPTGSRETSGVPPGGRTGPHSGPGSPGHEGPNGLAAKGTRPTLRCPRGRMTPVRSRRVGRCCRQVRLPRGQPAAQRGHSSRRGPGTMSRGANGQASTAAQVPQGCCRRSLAVLMVKSV